MKQTELKRKTPLKRGTTGLKRTAITSTPSKRQRAHKARMRKMSVLVRERADDRCEVEVDGERCWSPVEHCHHRLPVGRGGKDEPENLLGVCSCHHLFIHHHPAWALSHGYIRSTVVPA